MIPFFCFLTYGLKPEIFMKTPFEFVLHVQNAGSQNILYDLKFCFQIYVFGSKEL